MFIVPLDNIRRHTSAGNSKFIATLNPATSIDEARDFVKTIKAEFPDASHNVPAWIIGGGNSTKDFYSDDGEPAGTAGRPLLTVLKGSGMGNLVVVVTRFYGGTPLGTGGLVKAYTEAGQAVCKDVTRAQLIEVHELSLALPYHLLDRLRILARDKGATIKNEDFAEHIRLIMEIPVSIYPDFAHGLGELSSGSCVARIEDTRLARYPLPLV